MNQPIYIIPGLANYVKKVSEHECQKWCDGQTPSDWMVWVRDSGVGVNSLIQGKDRVGQVKEDFYEVIIATTSWHVIVACMEITWFYTDGSMTEETIWLDLDHNLTNFHQYPWFTDGHLSGYVPPLRLPASLLRLL